MRIPPGAKPAAFETAQSITESARFLVLIPVLLLLVGVSFAWISFGRVHQPIVNDQWFDADSTVMYSTLTDIHGYHTHRTRKHPIFSLVLFPLVDALAFV